MIADPHFQREDRGERWRRIARQVGENPACLDTALANIDRWLAWGRVHPAPLEEWRRRIRAAQADPAEFQRLVAYLEAANHDSEPLKSCSPFVGLAATV